jgi:ubiquinone/menaquinone biosynthesis C-methylase UbiE
LAKQGEIEYLARGGPAAADHARGKPFTDAGCGGLLTDIGGMLHVLPPPPARLLDLGCGSGWTSVMFARRGYDVVGQDIAPDMLALAEANRADAGLANLRFVTSDYESLAFEGEFDAAVFYDSLHHAVDPAAAMAGAYRALKPGAILVTVEPGAGHAHSEAARHAVAALGVTEQDMPPSRIVALGRAAGFGEAAIYPMPKTLAMVQFQPPRAGWPRALAAWYRWLVIGWVGVVRARHYGGMVVLKR